MGPTRAPGTASEPQRRHRRMGRVARLPKMNNSERGKYYRKKYKDHELGLEQSVTKLRKQVRDLELFMHVRDELAFRNPYDSCESVVGMIYEYFVRDRRTNGLRVEASFAHAEVQVPTTTAWSFAKTAQTTSITSSPLNLSSMESMMRYWGNDSTTDYDIPSAFVFFDLLSFRVQGSADAPVVVMRGLLHTKYTRATIDRMFPHLIHYQDLFDAVLDQETQYPCTYHFYFGPGGEFYNKTVEADYVNGLQQVVGNLEDVVWLLDGSHRYAERRDSLEEILRGPSSAMSLNYILA